MNFLRELVSGPKHRYKENGFNLDLTYMTERIIAMAFPASGLQKLYRNSIDSVSEFLANAHGGHYMVVNLSGREVDSSKLQNVHSFQWDDHQAPVFELLFQICECIARFLSAHAQHVVAVHCNHGKGRTGTLICCFFLYIELFSQANHAIQFYSDRRFQEKGFGVTQPCQVRYVHYFQAFLHRCSQIYPISANQHLNTENDEKIDQNAKILLNKMLLREVIISGSDFTAPYLKLYSVTKNGLSEILNTKHFPSVCQTYELSSFVLKFNEPVRLSGDILVQIKNANKVGKNLLASYTFHTGFISLNEKVFTKDLAPLSKQKDVSANLFLQFNFKACCSVSSPCKHCAVAYKQQLPKCSIIAKAMKYRKQINKQMLVGCKVENSRHSM